MTPGIKINPVRKNSLLKHEMYFSYGPSNLESVNRQLAKSPNGKLIVEVTKEVDFIANEGLKIIPHLKIGKGSRQERY